WWELEAPGLGLVYPGYFHERSYLYDADVLGEEERTELVAFWRRESERSFFYTAAPGEILHGAAARRKHFEWADIPRSLIERWQAERRPRRRQGAPLEEAAAK